MIALFNQQHTQAITQRQALEKQLKEVAATLERLEERFIREETEAELFHKYRDKYRAEKAGLESRLATQLENLSNLESMIETALAFASKLPSLWDVGDHDTKQRLQFLLFPDGITCNKQNGGCRTLRVNTAILQIAQQAKISPAPDNNDGGCFLPFGDLVFLIPNSSPQAASSCSPNSSRKL
jgi:site-specific DNA recombinase